MTAVAAIVLADALTTPVNHTFAPLGPDSNQVWWWEDSTTGSAIGNARISMKLTRPGNPKVNEDSSNRVCRVQIGIHTPTLETLSNNTVSGILPAPTVSYITRCNCEFILPERSVRDFDRKTIKKYMINLLANAQVIDMVEELRNVY
jgi:hypothetical protein